MRRVRDLLFHEPFATFVALGLLLYVATLAVRPKPAGETIVIPAETIRALVKQEEELRGRDVTPEEAREIVAGLVDDEVLLREARRRNFDENDSRVRRRLLAVMRSALDAPVSEPSIAELQAYYRENADRVRTEASVTFEHVFFSWGSPRLPESGQAFLGTIEESDDPPALGEPFPAGNRMSRESRRRLVLLFGPRFAEEVLALAPGGWTGPLESRSGTHYVRVLERHPPELAPFEEVESYLRDLWMFEKRREMQQKKIDELRQAYRIVLPEEYDAGLRRKENDPTAGKGNHDQ